MKIDTKSILSQAIKARFGTYNYNRYFEDDCLFSFFSIKQEKELLEYFKIDGYFLNHSLFDPYREQEEFQQFFSTFYCSSTLDLLLKLFFLKEILRQVDSYGISIFTEWTDFFKGCYNRTYITKRNMEMEAFLSLSKNTNKSQ